MFCSPVVRDHDRPAQQQQVCRHHMLVRLLLITFFETKKDTVTVFFIDFERWTIARFRGRWF